MPVVPQFSFETFDATVLQACLQYVTEAFNWLTASGDNLFQVMDKLDFALVENITDSVRTLLSNARSVQNAYAQINKLPPEILAMIFECLLDPPADITASQSSGWFNEVHFPIANSVCRYWRRLASSTPTLWTVIWIDRRRLLRHEEAAHFSSLSLSLSGTLPLSIFLDLPTPDIETTFKTHILANMSRIEDLRLMSMSMDFLLSLSLSAPYLRTLQLMSLWGRSVETEKSFTLFDGWQTPQLSSISMIGCICWRTATLGHLRHLTIAAQPFSSGSARALLHLLSCNPVLESLILSDLHFNNDSDPELGQIRQRVEMSNLKRLFIRNSHHPKSLLFVGLINTALDISTPDSCAKLYSLSIPFGSTQSEISDAFPIQALSTPTQLAIGPCAIVGTDSRFAFSVAHGFGTHLGDLLESCVDLSQVQELRLYHIANISESASVALERISEVTGLILVDYAEHWLEQIRGRNLFPALKDLCLMVQDSLAGRPILQFLKERKQADNPIHTMRFVRDPGNEAYWPTFNAWKRHSYKFAAHVERVQFDQSLDWKAVDLPSVCYTDVPIPGYWNPNLWQPSYW